eukprot:TRINITY_DN47091_c0_g2_i1.p1 TRINITY_DN47091_c0_g2~~TRINITY_DN47091_c0_g2_i1.p1  ORF type:complete len:211 (+),score=6.57 TRINITY_DN47091_c0_g2_i1:73-705(+)
MTNYEMSIAQSSSMPRASYPGISRSFVESQPVLGPLIAASPRASFAVQPIRSYVPMGGRSAFVAPAVQSQYARPVLGSLRMQPVRGSVVTTGAYPRVVDAYRPLTRSVPVADPLPSRVVPIREDGDFSYHSPVFGPTWRCHVEDNLDEQLLHMEIAKHKPTPFEAMRHDQFLHYAQSELLHGFAQEQTRSRPGGRRVLEPVGPRPNDIVL